MKKTIPILATLLWLCLVSLAFANDVHVSARINQHEIYIGQPFALTIVVTGADNVEQAKNLTVPNFDVQFMGQSQNSSIIITNGHRESSKTYELNYQFTPTAKTTLIPPITISVDGKPYSTQPLRISTKKPEKNDNFKLEVRLSKPTAYVGEPLLMTTTWFIGKNARGGAFNLPILHDPRFTITNREDLLPQDTKQLIKLELDGELVLARKYKKRIGSKDFMAITFCHTLIPKTTGEIILPEGTIAISALTGYETPRSRNSYDPFSRFNRQREIYSTIVIPTNPVKITVLPLPSQNRPPQFNGLIGNYTMTTSASPTTVNVGDPITLNLKITGDSANAAPMPVLALSQFKISSDKPKQTATHDAITFTTTIRAKNEQVQEVPAIPLAFFNPETKKYETSKAAPIPITVRETHIVTAKDALGGDSTTQTKTLEPRSEIRQGIHYNYSDVEQGQTRATGKLILWLGLIIPPVLFLLVVLLNRTVDSTSKEVRKRKRQALKQLKKDIKTQEATKQFDAWLTFLGNELHRPPQTITVQDISPHLKQHPDLAKHVAEIFTTGDAIKYGSSTTALDEQRILKTAEQIHKVLK